MADVPRARWSGSGGGRALKEVEGPGEGVAMGGVGKAGSFQERSHVLRRVNEGAKGIAPQPEPGVLQRKGRAHIPAIAGIDEGNHAARASGRGPKKRVHIGIAADDAVQSDDVGVGQGGCGFDEVSQDEMMAKKNRLTRVAASIGTAMGRADRKAHQIAKARVLAKKELRDIGKQVDALKRQLQKTTKRLKRALS